MEEELNRELIFARFKSFSLEKFQDSIPQTADFEEFLRNSGRHFSLNLPKAVNEYFIAAESAPYIWLSNHPVLIESEEGLKIDKGEQPAKNKQNSPLDEIKKFYANWILQKNEKEKQYFALSTINLIEKETNNKEYLKYFIYSTILAYEKTLNAPEKSIQLLYKSKEIVDTTITISPDLRKDLLYLINLYLGFIYLKDGAVPEADQKFSDALKNKPKGITASYYHAISQIKLGSSGKAVEYLSDIINFDKLRFAYAIKNNNIWLFNYFLINAVTYNIFAENDFSLLLNDIDFLLKTAVSSEAASINKISNQLESLETLPIKEFFDETITKNLKFIEKFIEHYKENKNFFISCVGDLLVEKLNFVLTKLSENIKAFYFEKAKEVLVLYEEEIDKNTSSIKLLNRELEGTKLNMGKKLEERIQYLEKTAAENIANYESRIEKMDNDPKFNPGAAFNSTMVYNVIISLVIFIIGGFGTGMVSGANGTDSFQFVFATIVLNGLKWGGIAFLLGVIVALVSSMSAIWERSNEKNRLIKEISVVKLFKERDILLTKEEFEKHIKTFEKNFGERIKQLENSIARVTKEKNEKSVELYNKADEKIKALSIYLEMLKINL
ncbi:MAG: hypothetical protein V1773_08405 [bacterium]